MALQGPYYPTRSGGVSSDPRGVMDTNAAGRMYRIASGDTLATLCPADGSVVPVSAGDRLYDGNTGLTYTARDIGGTVRWHGPEFALSPDAAAFKKWNGDEDYDYPAPYSADATAVCWHTWSFSAASTGAAHDAANNFDYTGRLLGTTVASFGSTDGLTGTERMYVYELDEIVTMAAVGGDPGSYLQQMRVRVAKNNAPADADVEVGPVVLSYVYA